MLSVFIDPGRTARGVAAKLSWLWPVITLAIVYMVFGYLMLPYTMQVVDARLNQALAQQGAPAERVEAARNITVMITRVAFLFTPVLIIGFLALFAWLVMVMGSMAGLRAKFRDVFALMSACSLIPALQYIAAYIVVRAKGDEITSQEQLTPPFGSGYFLSGHPWPAAGAVEFLFDLSDLVPDCVHDWAGGAGEDVQRKSVRGDHAGLGVAAAAADDSGSAARRDIVA